MRHINKCPVILYRRSKYRDTDLPRFLRPYRVALSARKRFRYRKSQGPACIDCICTVSGKKNGPPKQNAVTCTIYNTIQWHLHSIISFRHCVLNFNEVRFLCCDSFHLLELTFKTQVSNTVNTVGISSNDKYLLLLQLMLKEPSIGTQVGLGSQTSTPLNHCRTDDVVIQVAPLPISRSIKWLMSWILER